MKMIKMISTFNQKTASTLLIEINLSFILKSRILYKSASLHQSSVSTAVKELILALFVALFLHENDEKPTEYVHEINEQVN